MGVALCMLCYLLAVYGRVRVVSGTGSSHIAPVRLDRFAALF